MGLFNLFKNEDGPASRTERRVEWNLLESEDQLEELKLKSEEHPQIIFKNSTSCGISGMVLRAFESQFSASMQNADLHLLHVQYNRSLSNAIAQNFEVRHESPQLLIIRKGSVIAHASHSGITDIDLERYL